MTVARGAGRSAEVPHEYPLTSWSPKFAGEPDKEIVWIIEAGGMVMPRVMLPRAADVVWLHFIRKQAMNSGTAPLWCFRPKTYIRNPARSVLPITNQIKGYPFETAFPPDFPVRGVRSAIR